MTAVDEPPEERCVPHRTGSATHGCRMAAARARWVTTRVMQ
jgi:hypothetical protein